MTVLYISHPASSLHDPQVLVPDDPDHRERLAAIEAALAEAQLNDVRRLEMTLVHSEAHVAFIRDLCQAGGGEIDADTYVSEASDQAGARLPAARAGSCER